MQRCVDIAPHLTYVATLPCETRITEKINEIHRVPHRLIGGCVNGDTITNGLNEKQHYY